jgi:hypothetical protein
MTAAGELAALCAELEGVADIFGANASMYKASYLCRSELIFYGLEPFVVYRTRLGPTRLKLVMEPTKAGILAKVEWLKKAERAIRRETRRPSNRKPSLSVAAFNEGVVNRFIADGETQNAREYNALYFE